LLSSIPFIVHLDIRIITTIRGIGIALLALLVLLCIISGVLARRVRGGIGSCGSSRGLCTTSRCCVAASIVACRTVASGVVATRVVATRIVPACVVALVLLISLAIAATTTAPTVASTSLTVIIALAATLLELLILFLDVAEQVFAKLAGTLDFILVGSTVRC
jgi:hypothetical protein